MRGGFHVRRCAAFIHIEPCKGPARAEADGVQKLLFMGGQIILVLGLVEIADIHRHTERMIRLRAFVLDAFQPGAVLCKRCLRRGVQQKVKVRGRLRSFCEGQVFRLFHSGLPTKRNVTSKV